MSLDDKTRDDAKVPKNSLSAVLRQIELFRVPLSAQGDFKNLLNDYQAIYVQAHADARKKHPNLSETAIGSVAAVYAERAFGQHLNEKYHGNTEDVRSEKD